MTDENLYDALGVARDADTESIKKAYRKKANKAHPDKGGDVVQFQVIKHARDILLDPEKRDRYDRTGDSSNRAEPTMRDRALQNVGMLFMEILEHVDAEHDDIPAIMTQQIKKKMRDTQAQIPVLTAKIRKREKVAKRIKRKKKAGGDNVLLLMVNASIKSLTDQIQQVELAVSGLREMLTVVADYEYIVDERPPRQQHMYIDTPRFITTKPYE